MIMTMMMMTIMDDDDDDDDDDVNVFLLFCLLAIYHKFAIYDNSWRSHI